MKSLNILLVIMTFVLPLHSQLIPNFQFTLYAKDAIGNVDSVYLGFDTAATTDIDPLFGEEELSTPFDEVLEIRAGILKKTNNLHLKLSKKLITSAEKIPFNPDNCLFGDDMVVYVQAKYPPVTLFWDRDQFISDNCVKGSLLTFHDADQYTDPFDWLEYSDTLYHCMANENAFDFIPDSNLLVNTGFLPLSIEKEVQGQGLRKIYGIRFLPSPFPGWSPCRVMVNATDILMDTINLYPNPATDLLIIPGQIQPKAYSIFSSNGIIIKKGMIQNGQISVAELPKGLYLIYLKDRFGQLHVKKFIKT